MTDAIRLALYLPRENASWKLIHHAAEFFQAGHRLRSVIRKDAPESLRRRRAALDLGIRGVIAQQRIFNQDGAGIHAETIHSTLHPEAQHLRHGHAHLRISPIQVRLLREEGVVIVLARPMVPLPSAAAETTEPVVRRASIRCWVGPYEPVTLVIRP